MTLLEANALLLTMHSQREQLVQHMAEHANHYTADAERQFWDMTHVLNDNADRIEDALPEFQVEYMEEAKCYCLVPRRSLPYRSCRKIVAVLEAMR